MAQPKINNPTLRFIAACKTLTADDAKPVFTSSELKDAVTKLFPDYARDGVLPNDHCYNWTNRAITVERSGTYAPLFLRDGTDRRAVSFRYVGPNFRPPADIKTYMRPESGPHRDQLLQVVSRTDHTPVDPEFAEPTEEPPISDHLHEGHLRRVLVNAYERNPEARAICIAAAQKADPDGKLRCGICSFCFQDVYGELGHDYIHVHHRVPIATIGKEYKIDPLHDLEPVCPNCHAMLHRPPNETLSSDDLRSRMTLDVT